MDVPSDYSSTGTALGKEVGFQYVDGSLIIRGNGEESYIHDQDVIAVVPDVRADGKGEAQPQLILRLTSLPMSPKGTTSRLAFEPLAVTNLPQSYVEKHRLMTAPNHLRVPPNKDGSQNLYVIVSTRSGIGEAWHFFEDILSKALTAIGVSHEIGREMYNVHVTDSEKSVTEMVAKVILPRANQGIEQTVILLSGDGGVVDIVNVLLSGSRSDKYVKPTIGLIPMGTGNALATSSELNRDGTRGVAGLLRGVPQSIPTFTTHFSPASVFLTDEGRKQEPLPIESGHRVVHGVVVCSWALHASLVADSDTTEYRKFGAERFQMAVKQLMEPEDGSGPHVYVGKITLYRTDGKGQEYSEEIPDTKTSYIVATMVSNFEKSLTISPASKPLDGQMRVLRFGDISGADVMRLIGMAMTGGGHEKDEMAQYAPINGLKIEFDESESRWRRVCVDGKIIQVEEGGWMEVRRSNKDILNLVA
ncbi:MAG: hypothetical protein Q9182_003236 [Xanthomendoza sp. 2 TL-2023]